MASESSSYTDLKRHLIGEITQSLGESAALVSKINSNMNSLLQSGKDVEGVAVAWLELQKGMASSISYLSSSTKDNL